MEEAVVRLLDARDRGEQVAIVGDYDVDGVTATALLLAVFARLRRGRQGRSCRTGCARATASSPSTSSGRGRWGAA